MLKENENQLEGQIKFLFQPAEETFEGSKDISDYYKALNNKQLFKENILKLFNI